MRDIHHFIVATAGHVDHGKSALIKALTGTDPDRLPEEKVRRITIDLGFAHLELPSGADSLTASLLGIVDVPGHEDFVKNMVAGVGSIDLALLVVAADDVWMPQTEEHLQILTYLGVNHAVVVLTKIDLAADEKSVQAAIREKLVNTAFAGAPIVPTSIVTGRGLDELKTRLAAAVAQTPPPRDIGKPRLPVDRVFNLTGAGTIVTGTLTGGTLRRGQSVVIQPSGKSARIRSIQSHNRDVEIAGPGTRTALNLPNVTPDQDIRRGDVITLAECGGASETVDVLLEISPRASRLIKDGARVWIHHGSGSVAASIKLFSGTKLNIGERALAQLRLEGCAFFFDGDRFVVRDWAEQYTLCGGIVLDADALTTSFRSAERLAFLSRRAEVSDEVSARALSVYVISILLRDGAVERSKLLLKSHSSAAEINDAVSRLVSDQALVIVGNFVVDAAKWTALRQRAIAAIDAMARSHPETIGMPLNDLRAALKNDLLFAEMFDALVKELCDASPENEFAQSGALIRRKTHQPALPPRLQEAGARIRAALALKPFDPPSRRELTPDSNSQQALRFLIETGEAVEITADVVMAAYSEKRAIEMIRQFIRDNGPATVSELRQKLGSSRRTIIPLLERLDRSGVTVRKDDKRGLRK